MLHFCPKKYFFLQFHSLILSTDSNSLLSFILSLPTPPLPSLISPLFPFFCSCSSLYPYSIPSGFFPFFSPFLSCFLISPSCPSSYYLSLFYVSIFHSSALSTSFSFTFLKILFFSSSLAQKIIIVYFKVMYSTLF